MGIVIDKLFVEPNASLLEGYRDSARTRHGKITYDCYNAVLSRNGSDRVVCKFGFRINPTGDGSATLQSVLSGRMGKNCWLCPSFEGD